jgi:hypothetical protein
MRKKSTNQVRAKCIAREPHHNLDKGCIWWGINGCLNCSTTLETKTACRELPTRLERGVSCIVQN